MKGYLVEDHYDGERRFVGASLSLEGAKRLVQEDMDGEGGEWDGEWSRLTSDWTERDYKGIDGYLGYYRLIEMEVRE